MDIEKIFRQISAFREIVLDKILFESKYPVMFTCKQDNDIYLFICCTVRADIVEWIGTKTDYDNLIGLLENKITIRDAFLNVTDKKYLVRYDGQKVLCEEKENISDELLPSAGEYMDAEEDEYAEEIKIFEEKCLPIALSQLRKTVKMVTESYGMPPLDLPPFDGENL